MILIHQISNMDLEYINDIKEYLKYNILNPVIEKIVIFSSCMGFENKIKIDSKKIKYFEVDVNLFEMMKYGKKNTKDFVIYSTPFVWFRDDLKKVLTFDSTKVFVEENCYYIFNKNLDVKNERNIEDILLGEKQKISLNIQKSGYYIRGYQYNSYDWRISKTFKSDSKTKEDARKLREEANRLREEARKSSEEAKKLREEARKSSEEAKKLSKVVKPKKEDILTEDQVLNFLSTDKMKKLENKVFENNLISNTETFERVGPKKLDVIIVSVNYNDFLVISLMNNIKIFDNITVVTSSSDFLCQKICKKFDVNCIVTDNMYEDGAVFNKGKAVNEGIKSILDPDYILLLDADILVMEKIDIDSLDKDVLYTSDRYIIPDYTSYKKYLSGKIKKDKFTKEMNFGFGFFQLFNYSKFKRFPETSDDASTSDILFRDMFHDKRSINKEVLHIGEDSNWRGRKSKTFLNYDDFNYVLEKEYELPKKTFKICTFYYNPTKDVRRLENFLRFLSQFDEHPDKILIGMVDYDGVVDILPDHLKDCVVLLKGDQKNPIWYKEILLNKMIDTINDEYVIWMDCDIIYENLDWLKNINKVIKEKDFVQLYKTINYLNEDGSILESHNSILSSGSTDIDRLLGEGYKPGGSWIGKTSILKKKKFFEKMYVGGGDTIFVYGLFGIKDGYTLGLVKENNESIYNESIDWINSMGKYRMGFLDVSVNHLYHGDLKDRGYNDRYHKLRKKCSIIIPAYKAVDFITDCVESILSQSGNIDLEILIGIDDCQETLNFIEKNPLIKTNCRIFYFLKNSGPYLIRNTLVTLSKYDNIIFFDADDIMTESLLDKTIDSLFETSIVRWGFYNFTDNIEHKKLSTMHANGAFAIRKNVFESLNGFLPWKISADSEFRHRLKYNGYKTNDSDIRFLRRIHEHNLTQRKDTGMKSEERIKVDGKINKMVESNIFKNPKCLNVSEYKELDFEIDINKYFDKIYCLNLDRRPDRIKNMNIKLSNLNIEFSRFSAIDGNDIDISNYDLSNYRSSNDRENFKYEIACILSHIEMIKDAKKNGYNRILILEDDVLISNDIKKQIQKLNQIENWKMLYLGSSQYNWKIEKYGDDFFYSKDSLGTFAYAIDCSIYDELIEYLINFETTLDNSLSKIQLKYYKQCYTFFPNICIADVSDSDIRNSRDNITHSMRMRWNLLEDYV